MYIFENVAPEFLVNRRLPFGLTLHKRVDNTTEHLDVLV